MTSRTLVVSSVLFLFACGPDVQPATPTNTVPEAGTTAPPPPVVDTPDAAATPAPVPVSDAPVPPANPTELTDAQKKKDDATKQKITPFVDAFANVDPQLTKDGKHVLFRSNRDGLWQAYLGEVAKPSAAPKKLTSGTERVSYAHLTRDGKYVVYTSDEGADENFRIFRVNIDGTNVTTLTPGAKMHRDPPLLPRLEPGQMVYSAREASESKTHVFTQQIAGGDPKEVYVDPMPGFVVDVSPDGSVALFLRIKSSTEKELLRIDLDSKQAKRLYPQSDRKQVAINGAAFSPDAKRAYIATDDGGDGSYIVSVEASGILAGRYKEESPATAEIKDIQVSPKGDRIAVTVDAGNATTAKIFDGALKPIATVKSPLGTVETGDFGEDGKSFAMRLSAPGKPSDIYEVNAESGAMKPLRADVRVGFAKLPSIDVFQANVNTFDAFKVPINFYLPKNRTKLPVIVVVHGGPASSSRVEYSSSILWFVSQGYAVVEPNIRGSSGFGRSYEMADNKDKRGDALKDLEAVNTWTRAQPWCDDDRIVVLGGSYGGYMTLMALTRQPTLWRAGVDLVGPSNLVSLMKTTAGFIRVVLGQEFGDVETEKDLLAQWSPIKDVAAIQSPLFVYQGANDPRVPRAEADTIVNALRDRKIAVEYMIAANEGHSIDRREVRVEYLSRVTRFLDEQMNLPAIAAHGLDSASAAKPDAGAPRN
jgi:dipeptidyl aminopeptidase/acylaminoacyl peptidase